MSNYEEVLDAARASLEHLNADDAEQILQFLRLMIVLTGVKATVTDNRTSSRVPD